MRLVSPFIRAVAPLVGAWIEITKGENDFKEISVAPLVGAWIEIEKDLLKSIAVSNVAPLVGAWIEIFEENCLTNLCIGSPLS